MSQAEILQALAEMVKNKLGWTGELRPELRLVEDLELDSIQLLTLAMEVEDHFRVCLDEDDEAAIATVGDLTDLIGRKLVS